MATPTTPLSGAATPVSTLGSGFTSRSSDGPVEAHITTQLSRASTTGQPLVSLEFFPPKTQQGLSNLYARIARMRSDLSPAWIQITWGAGGTTQGTSLELAGRVASGALDPSVSLEQHKNGVNDKGERVELQEKLATRCCLHLTCTNVERASLDATLDQARELGIRNLLALRGDPPRGEEYWVASDASFQHAVDLVRYIRARHGDWFCIGVAGYPEGHCDAIDADVDRDIGYLKAKQDAGAQFVVTQLFYCIDAFLEWLRKCRQAGITIPIIPGIMPIQNYQSFRRMTNLCRTSVPAEVTAAIEPIRFDDAAVKDFGVRHAIHMIGRIFLESDVRAFHLCTLNLEKSVRRVLEGLEWVSRAQASTEVQTSNALSSPLQRRLLLSDRVGQDTPKELKVTTAEALRLTLERASLLRPPTAGAPPTQTATWDEFTNGRYGDSRSPAFGEVDGYGASLKVAPSDAIRLWGHPVSESDISLLFSSYLEGSLSGIPWCDIPILNETEAIRSELLTLNRAPEQGGKGWWTVGSQPAIDGVDSADPTFGFGPPRGYIFQKAFVEFFVDAQAKDELRRKIEEKGGGWIGILAGNRKGEYESNMGPGDVNAVTWGVFPGQEIAQSTIIEEESFKAWRDEAFAIWAEWELLFPAKSATRNLLHSIGEDKWLVTLIHHDYKNPKALWEFLDCAASKA